MKPALVGQLFERLERFVDWNTLASGRFENQADRANGREPDRHACSARCSVVRSSSEAECFRANAMAAASPDCSENWA